MEKLNVGLLGFGPGGVTHAMLIDAESQLALTDVVTSNAERAEQAKQRHGARISTFDEVLANDAIDIVVNASPTSFHFEHAAAALRAGKHIVVDKPLTVLSQEAEQLEKLAVDVDRKLYVFHNRRWDGDFLTVKRLIDEGVFGKLHSVDLNWDRWVPDVVDRWRNEASLGGGMLLDLGTHMIDQVIVLFGEPQRVYGNVRQVRPASRADDSFSLLMEYPDVVVKVSSSLVKRIPSPRWQLEGPDGVFVKYGIDQQTTQLSQGVTPGAPGWGIAPDEHHGVLTTDDGEQVIPTETGCGENFYAAVVEGIVNGKSDAPTASDAIAVSKVIEAVTTK